MDKNLVKPLIDKSRTETKPEKKKNWKKLGKVWRLD